MPIIITSNSPIGIGDLVLIMATPYVGIVTHMGFGQVIVQINADRKMIAELAKVAKI